MTEAHVTEDIRTLPTRELLAIWLRQPSPLQRALRWALLLAGATIAMLALGSSPAHAQDAGGGDSTSASTFSGSSYSSTDSSASGSSYGSSDSGLSGSSFSSTDSGLSGSGFSSTSDSGYGSDSGFSDTSTSDSGYGASSYGGYAGSDTGTTGFEGSPETGPAHATALNTNSSTYSAGSDTGDGSTRGFGSSESSTGSSYGAVGDANDGSAGYGGYGGSETGSTGFEGSPEVGPGHATAVNTDSPTYSSDGFGVDDGSSRGIGGSGDTSTSSSATGYAGSESGTTGFEGSPEVGPGHATAVNTDSPTYGGVGDGSVPSYGSFDSVAADGPAPISGEGEAVAADPLSGVPSEVPGITVAGPPHFNEINPEIGPALAAAILQNEAWGRQDAAHVRQALEALGVPTAPFEPTDLYKVYDLTPSDPRYAGLYDTLTAVGRRMGPDDRLGAYAQNFYGTLGLPGTRAVVGVVDQFGRNWAPSEIATWNPRTDLLGPLAYGFAGLTRSPGYGYAATLQDPQLATAPVLQGVLAPATTWQQHQLSHLISSLNPSFDRRQQATHYEPGFLDQAARTILAEQPGLNQVPIRGDLSYPPLDDVSQRTRNMLTAPDLREPEAVAMRALAGNPEASWRFTDTYLDRAVGPPVALDLRSRDHLTTVGYTPAAIVAFDQRMAQYAADVVRNTFIDAVAVDPSRFPEAIDRYADAIRMVGDQTIFDPGRLAMAEVVGTFHPGPEGLPQTYLDAIAQAALRQRDASYRASHRTQAEAEAARLAEDFNRVDLVDAWAEIGRSVDAARHLGQVMVGWTGNRTAGFLTDPELQPGEVATAVRPVALVLDTVRQGLDAIGVPEASDKAMADAIQYYGSMYAALAGPVANWLGGRGWAVPAMVAGGSGSVAWAGSTYLADQYRATDTPPVHGDDLSRIVAGTLRQDMAETVAAQRGWPTPAPGQMSETLDRAFPAAGDPFDAMLNLAATERSNNDRPGTHWGSR